MFWKQLLALPEAIQDFLDNKKDVCLGYQKKYQECVENPAQDPICPPYAQKNPGSVTYPRIRDYRNLPYLYVAASLLFSFMTDDDSALRVLHVAEANIGASGNKALAFKDYSFLQSAGQLSYYLGKPGDIGSSYFDYLEKMRITASGRVATLKGALESCADSACKKNVGKMLRRHWIAQLLATNKLAIYLAEDLARESGNAFNYVARVEEYAAWLEKADDEGTKREAIDKYYAVADDFRYYIMDTYLYAYLVLEARKTNADVEKFRKLKAQFQQVVEHIENEAAKTPNFKKIELTLVKIVRAHLASARELAGE